MGRRESDAGEIYGLTKRYNSANLFADLKLCIVQYFLWKIAAARHNIKGYVPVPFPSVPNTSTTSANGVRNIKPCPYSSQRLFPLVAYFVNFIDFACSYYIHAEGYFFIRLAN